MKITIKTRDANELEIESDTLITFPNGVPGFEQCKRYKVFFAERDEGQEITENIRPVYWLQAVEDPDVVFSVVDPVKFGVTYQVRLDEADVATLGLSEEAPNVAILTMVSKLENTETAANPLYKIAGAKVKPHLTGPIVVNLQNLTALQKVLTNVTYDLNINGS